MDIQIPVVPVGVLTLLAFFAPYAVAVINRPQWSVAQKRIVSIVVSVVLAAIVLAIYWASSGEIPSTWWAFFLLAVVVVAASYALVTKSSATALEAKTAPPVTN